MSCSSAAEAPKAGGGAHEERIDVKKRMKEGGRVAVGLEPGYIFNFCTLQLSSLSPRRVNQCAVCHELAGKENSDFLSLHL